MDSNPLFEAYAKEKLKEQEIEMNGVAERWVHVLRLHYVAAIKEGFTPKQSMEILDMLWRRSDERYRQDKEREEEKK